MPFLEEVAGNHTGPTVRECPVGVWLSQNTDVTAAELLDAREQYSLKAVWLTMKGRGFERDSKVVSSHLRGECKCPVSVTK